MKKTLRSVGLALCSVLVLFTACSKDDDGPDNPDDPAEFVDVTVGFQNAPSKYFGGPTAYGANLYYGAQDQITTGYLAQLNNDTYAQFSINYGNTYDQNWNSVWGYSFYNGGLALSNWHDMTGDTYENQLSVYNSTSPSGGNFLVAFASPAVDQIMAGRYGDYAGCPKIYITDAKGYSVKNPGTNSTVSGDNEDAFFKSVMINNTTYDYLTMKNGNGFARALSEELGDWFLVRFIAFDDDNMYAEPLGYVDAYLANFDSNINGGKNAAGEPGILTEWTKVDLSSLPECSILVIDFAGTDMGAYGLNTPAYCALDQFVISVEND